MEQLVLDALYEAFDQETLLTTDMLEKAARATRPLIMTAGKGLDEVWSLVENGRVQVASDEMLTRSQVAALIDPNLYRPMYCQLAQIAGFEEQASKAARFLMASPFGGAALAVMETGEPDWIYIQANFAREPGDAHVYKLIDRFVTLERNLLIDTLVADHGVEHIYFETQSLESRFRKSDIFSAYAELFKPV